MPVPASGSGSASVLNCGLARERGTERTSTRRATPAWRSNATSSATDRVEWPTVKIVICYCERREATSQGRRLARWGLLRRCAPRNDAVRNKRATAQRARGVGGSVHVLAAIDRQCRAGDEIGLIGDQEQHR